MFLKLMGCTLLASVLTACAVPAKQESNTPPHLLSSQGMRAHKYNNGFAFGPVPESLEDKGEGACEDAHLGKLLGYHSHAEYSNRQPAPGGGFLCDAPPPLIDGNKERA